jgi:membrane dipeptidase
MPPDLMERARRFRLPNAYLDRIQAGHQTILDELKPTKAQIEHGLELHYNSYVADAQGDVSVCYAGGIGGDRLRGNLEQVRKDIEKEELSPKELRERLEQEHRRRRTFESAFDPQWIEMSRALYAITNVALAEEDVAHPHENTFETALEHLVRSNFVYERRDDLMRVGSAEDIRRGRREGKTCVILHLAATGCFAEAEDPVRNLDLFYALGIRMSQLTYIQKNRLCCSWMQDEDTGLTELGRQAVRRMNELGVMVDIAHCGERSAMEVIEASSEPVISSHRGCTAIHDDSRDSDYVNAVFAQPYARGAVRPSKPGSVNISDDALRALGKKDGFVGIIAIHYVLGKGPESFHTWFRHVEHAIEVAGIDHVGIGSDRTFFPTWRPAPLDWTNWPYWTVGLVCQGLPDADIQKIIGGNYLRYAERVLDKRPWGALM